MDSGATRSRSSRYFMETPEGIRRLVLMLYLTVGPVFLLAIGFLSNHYPDRWWVLTIVAIMILSGGIWVFLLKECSKPLLWIYPVSISPTVCSGLAYMASTQWGPAFFVVMVAPMIWAAAIFPALLAQVAWATSVGICGYLTWQQSGEIGVAVANTVVFGTICGLVAWVVHSKAMYLRQVIASQKAIEEQLRRNEESYRNQFTHNSSMMMLIDPETGSILDANTRAVEFYGYLSEQIIGMRIGKINAILSPESIREQMDAIPLNTGGKFEFVHRVADGSLRNVSISASRILYRDKEAIHSIITDVTELNTVTERLISSEANFRTFFQTVEDLIFVADTQGKILFTNQAVVDKLGYSVEELRTMHVLDVHPESKRAEAEQIFKEMLAGVREICPLPLWCKNQTWLPVETRVWLGKWDGEDCIFGISKDMSREQESERKFNQIFQSNPALMGISSLPDRLFTDVNEAFLNTLGYTREELLGRTSQEMGIILDVEKQEAIRALLIREGRVRNLELRVKAKDGRILDGLFSGEIMESGGKKFFLTVMIDITDRKKAEEQLEETIVALNLSTQAANALASKACMAAQAKSDFLATMSHEIRTPMNGVIGMTGLLLDTQLDSEQLRYTQTIRASGEVLLAIINDILDFSKIESGMLELESMEFDLGDMMEDFADSLALRASEKQLDWTCLIDQNVPMGLKGDLGRLRQILTNLAGNAIKFTEMGEVVVNVMVCEQTRDEVMLQFSVKDTGIGIPQDKLEILFDKFTQVDSSTSRRFGGTGLGLAISKKLANLMGGDVGVLSSEGQGSTFWFTARFGIAYDSHVSVFEAWEGFTAQHILVIDDNLSTREMLEHLLDSYGLRVSSTSDTNEAWKLLSQSRSGNAIQIILIDSGLLDAEEDAFLAKLREEPQFAQIHLFLMMPLGRTRDSQKKLEQNFAGVLHKPVHRKALQQLFETYRGNGVYDDIDEQQGIQEVAERVDACAPKSDLSQIRILLVEDNPVNVMVAQGMLQKLGYHAKPVMSGEEALQILTQEVFDLVLLDCQMPGMDGYEVARTIRSGQLPGVDKSLPIVAMTANAMPGDREKCLESGMDDYLSKPIGLQILSQKLEIWRNRSQA